MIKIECDFICELCYKPGNHSNSVSWLFVWQSYVCPQCESYAKARGDQILKVKCGCYAYIPDPRAKNVD